jgi:hypothetical protein
MNKKNFRIGILFFIITFTAGSIFALPPYPQDNDAESKIKANWKTGEFIGAKKDGNWGTNVSVEKRVQVVRASIKYIVKTKVDDSVRNYTTYIFYILAANEWIYEKVNFSNYSTEAAPGQEAPSKDEIKKMISAFMEKQDQAYYDSFQFNNSKIKIPVKVTKVMVTDPESKDFPGMITHTFMFDFEAESSNGNKFKISDLIYKISKKDEVKEWDDKPLKNGVRRTSKTKYKNLK